MLQEKMIKACRYIFSKTPLGVLLVAATSRGICCVRLGKSRRELEAAFKKEFQSAELVENEKAMRSWNQAIMDYLCGYKPWPQLPYDARTTAFQKRVWDWLRTIPPGKTYSYSAAAAAMGCPKAARAVARACAANGIALVIPCHRIVPKAGGIGGYRWHPDRKLKLLRLEGAFQKKIETQS